LTQNHGVPGKLRVLALLALLLIAPAAMATRTHPDPTWIDIIQNWFETLIGNAPQPADEDGGTLHIPGG
jgi:hypothetical protein